MNVRASASAALLMMLMAAPAAEGQQLFSNFPVNGQISAFQVNGGYSVSESFTLATAGTVGQVSFGAWLYAGDSVTAVTWAIGTTPFGASSGTGIAGATSTLNFANADGFDVNTVTITMPGITLTAGTYYLTLSAAVSAGGNPVYWDINNAAGVDAWDSSLGHVSTSTTCFDVIGISGTCASSFQILSTNMNLTASPSPLSFSNQNVNTGSPAQSITITNNGQGSATIAGIAVTGTNSGDFSQTNNCPISPATLSAGGSCTVNVTFTPQGAGARSANLTMTGSSPLSVSVSGTGLAVAPSVTLSAPSLAFPNQMVNTTSAAQSFTITNNGPGTLTISTLAVSGTNSSDFAQTSNCPAGPASLAANAFCTVTVTFMPQGPGARSAFLNITDNGAGSPRAVSLSGTGTAATQLTWSNGYLYQATFTVAAGQVPTSQTNFPALISGTFPDFSTAASGGRISNTCIQTVGNSSTSVPCDLIFTSDAAGAVPLSWEFESYTATTGAAKIWVNAPNLANGTVIYAWYGQPSITNLQTTPSATWNNGFEAVYHLKENPAGAAPQMNDSTGNANHATMNGTVVATQQVPGEIGGSVNFNGNTWAGLNNPTNFSFERTDSFSLSGWFKTASNSAGTLISKFPVTQTAGWALLQFSGSSSPSFAMALVGGGGQAVGATPAIANGAWHYVVATYSGTSTVAGMKLYVDGVPQTLSTYANNLSASIMNTTVPAINGRGGANQMSTDTLDEIRISSRGVVFSPDWVSATYNNQSNPGAFFTVTTGLTNTTSAPAVSLSQASLSYASQTVNTSSAAQTFTVTNSGPGALTINSIALSGTNPGDFGQTNNCPVSPASIPASGFCTVTVTFTPQAAGARSAAVTLGDTGAGSPHLVGLSGTGTAVPSNVTLSASSLTFSSQMLNTTSSAQSFTVTNSGPSPLTISAIVVSGTNSAEFAQASNCPVSPATIAVSGFCTVNITFTPQAAGARSGSLSITDNGAGSPRSVTLSGTGMTASPLTWPNGYLYQGTFTVSAGQVPSSQSNFPALISGIFPDFATTASGGRISNTCTQTVGNSSTSVPCDLIFTSDAAGAVPLSWEFESYTAATGAAKIWVNAPNLANGTVIYAWYGQPSVITLQTTPSATWNNGFEAVYHLKENPAGAAPQMNDSTGNSNHATMNGTVLAAQQVPGEIGGSLNFNGNTWAGINKPTNFSFERTDSFSLSGWFKTASNSAGTLISKFPVTQTAGWALLQFSGSSSPSFALALVGGGQAVAATPAVTNGVWHYVVATYAGTGTVAGMQFYVDGIPQTLNTYANNLSASIMNTTTPAINGRGGASQMSTDTIDEIRISSKGVVFSPAWVTASYNNQSNPAAFFTVATGLTNH